MNGRRGRAPAGWRPLGWWRSLVAADLPGKNRFGLNFDDQPVLAEDIVRYAGEPIAVVAARSPLAAKEAVRAIMIDLQRL